jgi:hypothetical protein
MALFLLWQAAPTWPADPCPTTKAGETCIPKQQAAPCTGSGENRHCIHIHQQEAPSPAIQKAPQPGYVTGDPSWAIPGVGVVQPIPTTQKAPQPIQGTGFIIDGSLNQNFTGSYILSDAYNCVRNKHQWVCSLPTPPDFTPQLCDLTSLAGDCGYLFEPYLCTGCTEFDTSRFGIAPSKEAKKFFGDDLEPPCFVGPKDCPAYPHDNLAKSMARNGWSCTYDEIHIECTKAAK